MKKITITNASGVAKIDKTDRRAVSIIVEGSDDIEASDGFHTFSELYDHRTALYIALTKVLHECLHADNVIVPRVSVWRSKLHSDGSSFKGWFIMGINSDKGEQISYHLPMKEWKRTGFAQTLSKAPEWDGHTPADVLKRLKKL